MIFTVTILIPTFSARIYTTSIYPTMNPERVLNLAA